jgi:hypothetical protein
MPSPLPLGEDVNLRVTQGTQGTQGIQGTQGHIVGGGEGDTQSMSEFPYRNSYSR